jgi:hypothetical protein
MGQEMNGGETIVRLVVLSALKLQPVQLRDSRDILETAAQDFLTQKKIIIFMFTRT